MTDPMTNDANDTLAVEQPVAWLYESEDGSKELILDCNGEYARRLIELGWTEQPLFARAALANQSDSTGDTPTDADVEAMRNSLGPKFKHLAAAVAAEYAREGATPTDGVREALQKQMEEQAGDDTPSSLQRERGLIWLEGWFDLDAALSPVCGDGG